MNFYLYLTNPEWADAWISGGVVPFFTASRYISVERSGTTTPDENLIDNSTFDVHTPYNGLLIEGAARGLRFENCIIEGRRLHGTVDRYYEDGLVICTSTKRSKFIARKLGKKACVRILDIKKLIRIVEDATKVSCKAGVCEYTKLHFRNHFMKSTHDEWQMEFRLFWHNVRDIEILLPPRIATLEFVLP